MARWILGMTRRGKISESGPAHLQSGWKGLLGEDPEVRHKQSLRVETGYLSYFSKVLIIMNTRTGIYISWVSNATIKK